MAWLHAIWIGLLGAAIVEMVTVFLRFGFGWTSPERTRYIARLTRGWRVHHGYPGLLLIPIAFPVQSAAAAVLPGGEIAASNPAWWGWIGPVVLAIGIALAVSDLVHHVVVLPLTVGDHEFDLKYPDA